MLQDFSFCWAGLSFRERKNFMRLCYKKHLIVHMYIVFTDFQHTKPPHKIPRFFGRLNENRTTEGLTRKGPNTVTF